MNDNNERVRLAAAKILIESKLPNNNPVKIKAIQVLSELVFGGTAAGYRADAYAELSRLVLERPMHMMLPGGKLLKIEKVNGKLQGIEFTGDKQTGFIYADGGSFRFVADEKGALSQVWEDGLEFKRKQQSGQFIDEWDRPGGRPVWKGKFEVTDNGVYWFQAQNSKDKWTRSASGAWTKTVLP